MNNINFSWNGNAQTFTADLTLGRTNTKGRCKSFDIGFSTGLAGNYNRRMFSGSNYITYNLYKDNLTGTPLKTLNDASNDSELVIVNFPKKADTVKTVTFEGRFPFPNDGRSFLAKANYLDTISVTVINKQGNSIALTSSFQVNLNIPPEVNVSLVDAGNPYDPSANNYTMDFAVLNQGAVKNVDLKVKSNAGYTLSARSTNGGALKHKTKSDLITYDFKVSGTTKTFPGPNGSIPLGSGVGVTPVNGVNFPVSITITGNPSSKIAGIYEDTIYITASSNE